MKKIPPYSRFAQVYDRSMAGVPYRKWADFIRNSFKELKKSEGSLLDLGCGTGRLLSYLLPKWKFSPIYCMDVSRDMLVECERRLGSKVVCIEGDWSQLNLSCLDYVLSTHTTLNYIEDLGLFFRKVYDTMNKGGVFFFDFTSEVNIYKHFHNHSHVEVFGDCSLRWNTTYNSKSGMIKVVLDFENHKDNIGGSNSRGRFSEDAFQREIHNQYYHSPEKVSKTLELAGFSDWKWGGDYEFWKDVRDFPPGKTSPNLFHILAIK